MEIKEFLKQNKQNMLNDLAELVSYNSVSKYNPEAEVYPFGKVTGDVLDSALKMFEREGLATTNVDYYAGFGEVGKGEKLIGVLAHLDVVPAGEGWETDPFKMVEKDGKLFGRGTMDDKGPAIASLYAIKYLLEEKVELNKRIRLIVGLNEEAGSRGLAYYVKKEGHIDYGFTPDGSFPGIYGEKGHVGGLFSVTNSKIIDINGGEAANAVCSKVTVVLEKAVDMKKLSDFLNKNELRFELKETDNYQLVVYGTAAHASMPELGKNAISYLMLGLNEIGYDDPLVNYYNQYFGIVTDGSKFGCKLEDEFGALTFNNGRIYKENDKIYGTIDIRVPVTMESADIMKIMTSKLNDSYGSIETLEGGKPLFFDPKSPMVEALVSAYRDVTGDYENQPMVIGGGTYSKGINNCIAFGGEFVGEDNHLHDVGEFIGVDRLLLQTEIYIKAILNLLSL
jgi:succinyl-diaminopimelate desuccinylase